MNRVWRGGRMELCEDLVLFDALTLHDAVVAEFKF